MHYIGIDLAWGELNPSGVAVLDAEGRLVHVSAESTDEAIAAALEPFRTDPVLVAIDAPLVVNNPTGNRPCEAALNRDFARFDAGAHPANTGKPEFAGTPRGARVAKLLGLDINPTSGRPRRAIEVYPHPASVALFRLGRTLKYKQRPGRGLEELRAAMLTLVSHLEGLAHAESPMTLTHHPQWQALVAGVRTATRKSELRRAEDQVDAVLCAYIARYAVAHPESTTTYGDLETGYIVTPTLPAGLEPAPRVPAPPSVKQAVQAYAVRFPELQDLTDRYVALVTELLDEAGINYLTVAGRTKSVASFAGKAARTAAGVPLYTDPLREITDQIGVRVVTYVLEDVQAVVELLADQLSLLADRDMGLETAREGRFGYASRHVLVSTDDAAAPGLAALAGVTASVQIRTVLQHAWAEFEHDVRYKGTVPEAATADLDRRFTLAAGLIELADREFSAIHGRMQDSGVGETEPAEEPEDPRIGAQELAAFLAGRFPGAGWSRNDHYEWVSGLLLELGITSLTELGDSLRPVDSAAISAAMGYRYPPGAVRRLDDALLSVFGEDYVRLHGNARRAAALAARLAKLRE